jgi:hypothetical protein
MVTAEQTALAKLNGNYNTAIEQSGNNCYIRLWNDSVAASAPFEESRWKKPR